MIKSGEYIQLLQFFSRTQNMTFINNYARIENIEIIEACKRFDELRIIHQKIKSECENWELYPHKDLKNLTDLKNEMIRICTEFKICVGFYQLKSVEFKNGIHAFYSHRGVILTDMIVFAKKRKESSLSH